MPLVEVAANALGTLRTPHLARRVVVSEAAVDGGLAVLTLAGGGMLKLPADQSMNFGGKYGVSHREYIRLALEPGDAVDILCDPRTRPFTWYAWVSIRYMEERPEGLDFSQKDDGDFAFLAKSGEKGQRVVGRLLAAEGHRFADPESTASPGEFRIWYTGKKRRTSDLTCSVCGVRIEVKRRNYDTKLRISHSDRRPFDAENRPQDWHAWVTGHADVRFATNASIIDALRAGRFDAGSTKWDQYADLDAADLDTRTPTGCR